ncbi:MAG: PQQ-binding-like beta-propeller repeat protein, partial [Candidatus Binataceae bacterium]
SATVDSPVSAASIPSDGIAVGSSSGALTTLATSGAVVWTANVTSGIAGDIAATAEAVYVASKSGTVHAFDARTGAQVWRVDTVSTIRSGPASDGAGRIVFASDAVYSVSADATAIVRFDVADARIATPLADGSGRVFVARDGGYASMLSSDGIELWSTRSFGEVEAAVASGAGVLFIANADGRVFAVR